MENKIVKVYKTSENYKYCFCKSSRINYLKSIVGIKCKKPVQKFTKNISLSSYCSRHLCRMCHNKIPVIINGNKILVLTQGQKLNLKTFHQNQCQYFSQFVICEKNNEQNAIMA